MCNEVSWMSLCKSLNLQLVAAAVPGSAVGPVLLGPCRPAPCSIHDHPVGALGPIGRNMAAIGGLQQKQPRNWKQHCLWVTKDPLPHICTEPLPPVFLNGALWPRPWGDCLGMWPLSWTVHFSQRISFQTSQYLHDNPQWEICVQ